MFSTGSKYFSPKIIKGQINVLRCKFHHDKSNKQIKLNKVLVISKMTRYDYERKKLKHLSDEQFEKELRNRGTNFDKLVFHNQLQKTAVDKVCKTLRGIGSDVKVVNRFTYTKDYVDWADVIVPTGGDGTFLLAASMIHNPKTPVIGLNSDPSRSEGFLCLPPKYAPDYKEAFQKIEAGDFQWIFRSRIKTKIKCANGINAKLLHETPDYDLANVIGPLKPVNGVYRLPVLSLNEVFIGETLSARVSHLELKFDLEERYTNTKCSGVCICTGTGSTSWHYSINRQPAQTVAEILKLMDINATDQKQSLASVFADIYNQNLKFSPEDPRMAYTIRDLICAGVWPDPKGLKSRGFVKRIEVRSNCDDGYIVIDGGISFSFNDGTVAIFEMDPRDSLKTIMIT